MKIIELSQKQVEIEYSIENWEHAKWHYEIVRLFPNKIYKAKLWLYDEYDGYLARDKVYKISPEYFTLEEAEAYAIKNWVR